MLNIIMLTLEIIYVVGFLIFAFRYLYEEIRFNEDGIKSPFVWLALLAAIFWPFFLVCEILDERDRNRGIG